MRKTRSLYFCGGVYGPSDRRHFAPLMHTGDAPLVFDDHDGAVCHFGLTAHRAHLYRLDILEGSRLAPAVRIAKGADEVGGPEVVTIGRPLLELLVAAPVIASLRREEPAIANDRSGSPGIARTDARAQAISR